MLSINELKPGTLFMLNQDPYEVLEAVHSKIARGGAVLRTKIKNLRTGTTLEKNFTGSDKFEEAEIKKERIKFIYSHREKFVFADKSNKRHTLPEEAIKKNKNFLKEDLEVEALYLDEKLLNIILPIKVDYKVKEAPPAVRGNTAQGGTKTVVTESGAEIKTPMFIEIGDVIRVNTKTGEYVERIKKNL